MGTVTFYVLSWALTGPMVEPVKSAPIIIITDDINGTL